MKVELPLSKPSRAVSSVDVVRFDAATGERDRRPRTPSARSVWGLSSLIDFGPERIEVPADSMSWLTSTTRPS